LRTHYAETHVETLLPIVSDYGAIVDAYNATAGVGRLPTKIQKCSYCNHYVAADDARLKGETIDHRQVCTVAPSALGLKPLAFEVVSDIRQIRNTHLQYILDQVGTPRRCNLCSVWFFKQSEPPLEHLWQVHGQGELW
jgi:hypothetical protein